MKFQDLPDELQRKIMYGYNSHPVAEIMNEIIYDVDILSGFDSDYSEIEYDREQFITNLFNLKQRKILRRLRIIEINKELIQKYGFVMYSFPRPVDEP